MPTAATIPTRCARFEFRTDFPKVSYFEQIHAADNALMAARGLQTGNRSCTVGHSETQKGDPGLSHSGVQKGNSGFNRVSRRRCGAQNIRRLIIFTYQNGGAICL